jgi:hypothetical protein
MIVFLKRSLILPWTSPLRVLKEVQPLRVFKEARPLRVFKEARPLRVFKEARPDLGPKVGTECGTYKLTDFRYYKGLETIDWLTRVDSSHPVYGTDSMAY